VSSKWTPGLAATAARRSAAAPLRARVHCGLVAFAAVIKFARPKDRIALLGRYRETDLYAEAGRFVAGGDRAVMLLDSSLRDCEAQPDAAGRGFAGFLNAEER
jgi:hypothetical protein